VLPTVAVTCRFGSVAVYDSEPFVADSGLLLQRLSPDRARPVTFTWKGQSVASSQEASHANRAKDLAMLG
jgi:hypothetical protein